MSAEPHVTQPRRTATILVVEDDDAVREATVWILKLMGYDTREAANGPAALKIIDRDSAIQVMFSDVIMPKAMNGVELAKQARHRRPDLKILLTTGYSTAEISHTSLTDMGIRVITKPYANDDLDCMLQDILAV